LYPLLLYVVIRYIIPLLINLLTDSQFRIEMYYLVFKKRLRLLRKECLKSGFNIIIDFDFVTNLVIVDKGVRPAKWLRVWLVGLPFYIGPTLMILLIIIP